MLNQIQREEQERITQSIIRAALGHNNLLQVFRDILIRKLALDDRIRQHRIRRRHACAYRQRLQEIDVRHERKHKQARYQPHDGHAWAEQQRQRPPFCLEILGRELHARKHELHA
jgi:hypothetical protein